ncbi:hypothetical protein OG393_32505 (plasmid) [Streptomyces sp. NBC_01216]|uniref:hypothetical protein n=1 Tax=Streptomyces sp. NBC_01216 TaxID=2903778 RepID=UPI002E0D5AE9|nr:hypothetical protein OG393_32505 [Streptomyces sp. NBC_01216]
MTAQTTFTTVTGATYSAESSIGENGEVTYTVKRIVQEGVIPVGSFVIHPDYDAQPTVPGLVNVQFGAGSAEDRHQRTDVPALGSASTPFVVGHKKVNPLDITATSPIIWLHNLAGAQYATGVGAVDISGRTAMRTADLVTALVVEWMKRDDLAELTAKYAEFIKSETPWTEQHAKAKADKIDMLKLDLLSIGERIADLTKQRDELPENGMTSPDVTPDMAPAAQLTGAIAALNLKRADLADELTALTKA